MQKIPNRNRDREDRERNLEARDEMLRHKVVSIRDRVKHSAAEEPNKCRYDRTHIQYLTKDE
jgi:hypothetical protein